MRFSFISEYSLTYMLFILGSGILGIAFDDFSISVLDIETWKIVRKFSGHHGRINDMVIFNSFSAVSYTYVYLIHSKLRGYSLQVFSHLVLYSAANGKTVV